MKRNRPLSYEELVTIVDEMSDIDYLSDDNDQNSNSEDINRNIFIFFLLSFYNISVTHFLEILTQNNINDVLENEEIADEFIDDNQNFCEMGESTGLLTQTTLLQNQVAEPKLNVDEYMKNNDLTTKKDIAWKKKRNISYSSNYVAPKRN